MSSHSTKSPLRFYFFAAALWFSAAPAFGQQFMELPPLSVVGNMNCCAPNPGSAVTMPQLLGQLSANGLQLDQMTRVGDAPYSILPSDRVVSTLGPLSTSRTWMLPAAANTTAGHTIVVVDLAGGITGSNTLVIARSGSDTINGLPSVTINVVYGAYYLVSDGSRAWNAQALSGISVTPGGGLTSSVSAACLQSSITGFGTLSAAECVNPQTGTSYAIQDGDRAKLITASNSAAQAYSIAQAGAASAFQAGWHVDIRNISANAAGIVTVTPATSTINGAATLQIYPGQSVRIISDGTNYQTAFKPSLPALTNSVASNVSLSNASNYFDGPSVAQGNSGTWMASGNVTITDGGVTNGVCKLWDGTTVIDSSGGQVPAASGAVNIHLSGYLASPANNIKISCKWTSTTAVIAANFTGSAKDSTISAYQIQ
jgi:hypothetical protein